MPRYRHDPFKDLVGFLVGDVMYAVRIEVVREIVNPLPIVDLPRAPESVKGVADYRGDVVPVVDLRERFGLPPGVPSRKTKWIVLDVSGGRTARKSVRRPDFEVERPSLSTGAPVDGTDIPARQTGAPTGGHAAFGRQVGPLLGPIPGGKPLAGARIGPPLPATGGTPVQGRYAALVVDSMTEVFGLAGGELRPAPPLGDGDDKRGIEGVTTLGSRLVFVLDARAFGAVTHAALSWAPGVARAPVEAP
jgi:chemotaxis signal transduction protein